MLQFAGATFGAQEGIHMMYVLVIVGVVGFMSVYYWRYFSNIKKAGPRPPKSSIGMPTGYAPLAIFGPDPRPRIETAEQAWPGANELPRDSQKPSRANTFGENVRQELVRVSPADGAPMTFFVEGPWVAYLQTWAGGGAAAIDPRWTQPAA